MAKPEIGLTADGHKTKMWQWMLHWKMVNNRKLQQALIAAASLCRSGLQLEYKL